MPNDRTLPRARHNSPQSRQIIVCLRVSAEDLTLIDRARRDGESRGLAIRRIVLEALASEK